MAKRLQGDIIKQLKAFNFQSLTGLEQGGADLALFARGIKHWTNHELLEARAIFERIYLSNPAGDLGSHVPVVLLAVLLILQDYKAIEGLDLVKSDFVDASEVGLALAFSGFPQERYSFMDLEARLSFEFSQTGCPVLEVGINGVPKRLWLDTGASVSVLARSTADTCGVGSSDSSLTATADNTQFEVGCDVGYVENISVAGLRIENHPLIILDDEMLQLPDPQTKGTIPIEGILGWNAIRNMNLIIDYQGKTIRISKPRLRAGGSNTMFAGVRPIIYLKRVDGKALYFGLDTGAGFSSISENALPSHDLAEVESYMTNVATVGGMKEIHLKQITDYALCTPSGHRLLMDKLKVVPSLSEWATFFDLHGVLGSDALKHSVLKTDFMNGIVEIHDGNREGTPEIGSLDEGR